MNTFGLLAAKVMGFVELMDNLLVAQANSLHPPI
tara:strand:- start:5389 stop:5490 length:102 start_codon:yes stop_codon:yes gene_type:complete